MRLQPGEETRLTDGDKIQLGDDRDDAQGPDKIVAVVRLSYPNVNDTMIPSSLQVQDTQLDKTGSWEDLLNSLQSIENRSNFEEEKLQKVKVAMKLSKELGLTHREAVGRVGL